MKKFIITFKGQQYELDVEEVNSVDAVRAATASVASVPQASPAPAKTIVPKPTPAAAVSFGKETLNAPMPGKILSVNVKPGESVKRGAVLMILEAMKMQNEIVAPHDSQISEVCVSTNAVVSTGDVLLVFG
ncbi:biotin/lipoyl-binding protein [bacterium BFN5]|nr:biotin/lipoyl-binding protein [bacterium BFN5]QJW47748.1 biotin/lipoyl-binding protein [bacterium BFN5]